VSHPENGKGRAIRTVVFDNAKELVAGGMDELYEQQGIRVISSLTHRLNTKVLTPRWAFLWNFENGSLVKHKARLVARGFAQVFCVNYKGAHLCALVMRLESLRVLASIAALSDLDPHSFDVSAAHPLLRFVEYLIINATSNSLGLNLGTLPSVPRIYDI